MTGSPAAARPQEAPAGELILWRHGQTDYNASGRIQGQVDIPLNELGLEQARRAAPALAALGPDRLISSPLERARQTAHELSALTGIPVETDPGLIERSFGVWEGLTRQEMEDGWPDAFAAWRRGEDPDGVDVETRDEAATRVGGALRRIAAEHPGERVVVVAHGAAITLGATNLLGMRASAWFGLRGLDNCHWAQLRPTGREPGWLALGWNLDAPIAPARIEGAAGGADIGAFLS